MTGQCLSGFGLEQVLAEAFAEALTMWGQGLKKFLLRPPTSVNSDEKRRTGEWLRKLVTKVTQKGFYWHKNGGSRTQSGTMGLNGVKFWKLELFLFFWLLRIVLQEIYSGGGHSERLENLLHFSNPAHSCFNTCRFRLCSSFQTHRFLATSVLLYLFDPQESLLFFLFLLS